MGRSRKGFGGWHLPTFSYSFPTWIQGRPISSDTHGTCGIYLWPFGVLDKPFFSEKYIALYYLLFTNNESQLKACQITSGLGNGTCRIKCENLIDYLKCQYLCSMSYIPVKSIL